MARSLRSAELEGRRVLLRADLNVPLEEGEVADETRLEAVLPTVRYILEEGGSVIAMSHLGRPGGSRDESLSLRPVAERLGELLGRDVSFAPDCVGARVATLAAGMRPGDVLLLENLRFHPEEKAGDSGFASELAALADLYVNDAFGTCHRAHASMTGVPEVMGGGYMGFLVQRELEVFEEELSDPDRPFVLLLGGAKVSDKLPVIENLLDKLDTVLIGGGMAFTFMRAEGMEIGGSLLDEESVDRAAETLRAAGERGVRVLLPADVVVAPSPEEPESAATVPAEDIPRGMKGLDIGPETVDLFAGELSGAGTVVWNGPMGVFEVEPFDEGTRRLAEALARATDGGSFTVVGGGDSARALAEAGLEEGVSFVSTGGGASLTLLQGRELPAVSALGGGS